MKQSAIHGNVTSIRVNMPPGPTPAQVQPGPAFVLEVQARLALMAARQLPRLEHLCQDLEAQATGWHGDALERALSDHLAAVAGLRFELLVPMGLRAGALVRDEEAFRQQVTSVSACTELTWTEVKHFLDRSAQGMQAMETFSDFVLEVRSMQREVSELAPHLDAVAADLKARQAAATTELGLQALAELMHKAASTMQRLAQVRSLCDAGYGVQKISYRLGDEGAACRGTLRGLAQKLGHGLLERLRALIALEHFAPGEEMRAAQQARSELQVVLADAIRQITRLQEIHRELAMAIVNLGEEAAAVRAAAAAAAA